MSQTSDKPILIGKKQAQGRRANMEDRIAARHLQTAQGLPLTVAMIADGIGGQNCGEVAAQMAINVTFSYIESAPVNNPDQVAQLLSDALKKANESVIKTAKFDNEMAGMGTTATITAIYQGRLYLANVGDSRAYLVRKDRAVQLTVDHTWSREMVRQRQLPANEAQAHPKAEALVRSIGYDDDLNVDLGIYINGDEEEERAKARQGFLLQTNDRLVLCSDGLIKKRAKGKGHFVEDDEIVHIVIRYAPDKAASNLVKKAESRKVDDNVSVIVLEMPGSKRKGGLLPVFKLFVFALLLFGLLGGLGSFLWFGGGNELVGVRPTAVRPPTSAVQERNVAAATAVTLLPTPEIANDDHTQKSIPVIIEEGSGLLLDNLPFPESREISPGQSLSTQNRAAKITLPGDVPLNLYLDKETTIKIIATEKEFRIGLETGLLLVETGGANVTIETPAGNKAMTVDVMSMRQVGIDRFEVSCLGEAKIVCQLEVDDLNKPLAHYDMIIFDGDNISDPTYIRFEYFADLERYHIPGVPTPTPIPTATSTPTFTPTATNTPLPTSTPLLTTTVTTTPAATLTATPTPTEATDTPVPTHTPLPTETPVPPDQQETTEPTASP